MDKSQIGLNWRNSQSKELFCERNIIDNPNYLKILQKIAKEAEYKGREDSVTPVGSWKFFPEFEFTKYPGLLEYIESRTYPYDEPIQVSFMKWYGEGHFQGIHEDQYGDYALESEDDSLWYINSIVICSEGLVGGQLVIGGDHYLEEGLGLSIMKRTKVLDITTEGNGTVWHEFTTHGVAEILKGERISLIVTKKSKDSRMKYKTGKMEV